jgi:hypothetical protein
MFKDAVGNGTFCYRTADEFDKVVEYYKKQKGLEPLSAPGIRGSNKAMVFCKTGMQCASLGHGVDISISTPWSGGQDCILIQTQNKLIRGSGLTH